MGENIDVEMSVESDDEINNINSENGNDDNNNNDDDGLIDVDEDHSTANINYSVERQIDVAHRNNSVGGGNGGVGNNGDDDGGGENGAGGNAEEESVGIQGEGGGNNSGGNGGQREGRGNNSGGNEVEYVGEGYTGGQNATAGDESEGQRRQVIMRPMDLSLETKQVITRTKETRLKTIESIEYQQLSQHRLFITVQLLRIMTPNADMKAFIYTRNKSRGNSTSSEVNFHRLYLCRIFSENSIEDHSRLIYLMENKT